MEDADGGEAELGICEVAEVLGHDSCRAPGDRACWGRQVPE